MENNTAFLTIAFCMSTIFVGFFLFILLAIGKNNAINRVSQYRTYLKALGAKLKPEDQDNYIVGLYRGHPIKIRTHDTYGDAVLEINIPVRHVEGMQLWISPDGLLFNTVASISGNKRNRSWTGDTLFDNKMIISSTPLLFIGDVLSGQEAQGIRMSLLKIPRVAIDMSKGRFRCYPNPANLYHVSQEDWSLYMDTVIDLVERIEAHAASPTNI